MHTLVFNSQKGGSGKTTLCMNLAVAAELAGDGPVYLIDTDPQGTLSRWHQERDVDKPGRVEPMYEEIAAAVAALRDRGVAWCFIDTAPARNEDVVNLFKLADLVVVPVRPSLPDVWSASVTVRRLKQNQTPFLFVLSQVKKGAAATGAMAALLSKYGQVAETFIVDRVGYGTGRKGATPLESASKSPAAVETAELWANVKAAIAARGGE